MRRRLHVCGLRRRHGECERRRGLRHGRGVGDVRRRLHGRRRAATEPSTWRRESSATAVAVRRRDCDLDCTVATCGDGTHNSAAGEACDDGNGTNGDGCDNNCTVTACGNGVRTGTEECDDGDLVSGDGCDANCTLTACGNGITTAGEDCDTAGETAELRRRLHARGVRRRHGERDGRRAV